MVYNWIMFHTTTTRRYQYPFSEHGFCCLKKAICSLPFKKIVMEPSDVSNYCFFLVHTLCCSHHFLWSDFAVYFLNIGETQYVTFTLAVIQWFHITKVLLQLNVSKKNVSCSREKLRNLICNFEICNSYSYNYSVWVSSSNMAVQLSSCQM